MSMSAARGHPNRSQKWPTGVGARWRSRAHQWVSLNEVPAGVDGMSAEELTPEAGARRVNFPSVSWRLGSIPQRVQQNLPGVS